MNDGLKDKHRSAIVGILAANDRIERAVLFGSRAMETHTSTSDVDIALFGASLTLTDQADIASAIEELSIPQRVDLLLYKMVDDHALLAHIEKHGVEWYRCEPRESMTQRKSSAGSARMGERKRPGPSDVALINMGLDRPVDITADQRKTLLALLKRHLPNTTAWAYGSRVKWSARPQSDLDLVVFAKPEHERRVSELREAFEESNLPFRVDLLVWRTLPEQYRKQIEAEHVVLVAREEQREDDGWTECRLADACSSTDYGLTASASSSKTGPHFLRITDIVSGHIDWKIVPRVVVEEDIESKYQLYDGDIVIARTGASTGVSTYVKNPPPAVFASYLVRLQAKPGFDARFLAYYLKSQEFWEFIRGVLGDKSAQPNASASTMTAAPLRVPKSKIEQRAIAHILGTLDDKIELNRRMNETLEALAWALFKSWFIDFDPVRAKMAGRDPGLPQHLAALFPDRLVDSELGPIPEEWEVKALDKIANFQNGLALQKFRPTENEKHLPVVKIAQLRSGKADSEEWATENITPECIVDDGDVIFSWSGSLMVKIWCGGRAALNQHLFKVTSSKYPKWFYLHCIESHLPEFQSIAGDKATTMGHIKRHHLSEAKCAVPDLNRFAATNDTFSDLLAKRISNVLESRSLVTLRDALLPKLISGKLRINEHSGYLTDKEV